MTGDPAAEANRYLRTDALRADLRGRSIRSGAVSLGARLMLGAVSVLSAAVLARLLTPRDFGLLAMASTLTTFVNTFRDFGLPLATVHREDIDHRQVGALFWVNLALSALIGLLMAAMAPVLAWFYGDPRLTGITLVVTAATFVGSVGVQHEALLQRQMRFGALTAIEVGAAVVGVIAGVALAALGAGYWALVAQLVALHLTRSASLWTVCRWRPGAPPRRWPGSEHSLRPLFSYGFHHAAARVLSHVGRKLDQVLVGRFGGAAVLGLYSSASRWSQFPFRMIYSPLVGVAVASFSRVQHEPAAYRAHIRLALEAVFAGSLPVLAFLFAEGRLVIQVLLGDQWLSAAPLFRILCIAAFVVCVTRVTKWLYLSQGATRREFHWAAISTPLMILGVVAGVPWGAMGVAVGYTAAELALAYPAIAFCLATSHLSRRDFFAAVARPAIASLMGTAMLFASGSLLPGGDHRVPALLTRAAVFWAAVALSWVLLPGGRRAAADLLGLARELWPRASTAGPGRDASSATTPAGRP